MGGGQNSFFGFHAGVLNVSGNGNSFFGYSAGRDNNLGRNNSFFGFQAGSNNTGNENSAFGWGAGNNNKTGILVESKNSSSLLEEILDLISNKEKAKNLSNAAYEEVKKYDWNLVGSKYLSIYDSLLDST